MYFTTHQVTVTVSVVKLVGRSSKIVTEIGSSKVVVNLKLIVSI